MNPYSFTAYTTGGDKADFKLIIPIANGNDSCRVEVRDATNANLSLAKSDSHESTYERRESIGEHRYTVLLFGACESATVSLLDQREIVVKVLDRNAQSASALLHNILTPKVLATINSLTLKHVGMGSMSDNRSEVFGELVNLCDGDENRAFDLLLAAISGKDIAIANRAAIIMLKMHDDPPVELIEYAARLAKAEFWGDRLAESLGATLRKQEKKWDPSLQREALGAIRHIALYADNSGARSAAIKVLANYGSNETTRTVENIILSKSGDEYSYSRDWKSAIHALTEAQHQFIGPALARICETCEHDDVIASLTYRINDNFNPAWGAESCDRDRIFDRMLRQVYLAGVIDQVKQHALAVMIRIHPDAISTMLHHYLTIDGSSIMLCHAFMKISDIEPFLAILSRDGPLFERVRLEILKVGSSGSVSKHVVKISVDIGAKMAKVTEK